MTAFAGPATSPCEQPPPKILRTFVTRPRWRWHRADIGASDACRRADPNAGKSFAAREKSLSSNCYFFVV
jgi:hypothetical protein